MADDFYSGIYNTDVLSCLANLSSDEVFTPLEIVNQMIDLIPQELFQNPETKFLDIACKSGVFLRETAKRLLKGLEPQIPDLQQRKDGRCVFCGASQGQLDRDDSLETHAYEMIHTTRPEEIVKMKFDVIIGNPPYQLSDGGGSNKISAKPIYHYFVEQAKKLNPRYLTMIIPSRWFAGGKGLDDFRDDMLNDSRIHNMVNYPKSRECFEGVDIAGGVCYFLWDRDYKGDCEYTSIIGQKRSTLIRNLGEFTILVPDNIGVDVIHKVNKVTNVFMSDIVLPRNSFGFVTSSRGVASPFQGCVKLISSDGISYVAMNEILKNTELVDKYKVSVGTLNPDRGGVNNASDGKVNVTTKVRILKPNEVVTETYIVLNTFANRQETDNFASYVRTKFVRYLISLTITSMHIVRDNFRFVPVEDFSKPWTDEELYTKYGLTEEEIEFIESMIRPMDAGDGENGE